MHQMDIQRVLSISLAAIDDLRDGLSLCLEASAEYFAIYRLIISDTNTLHVPVLRGYPNYGDMAKSQLISIANQCGRSIIDLL